MGGGLVERCRLFWVVWVCLLLAMQTENRGVLPAPHYTLVNLSLNSADFQQTGLGGAHSFLLLHACFCCSLSRRWSCWARSRGRRWRRWWGRWWRAAGRASTTPRPPRRCRCTTTSPPTRCAGGREEVEVVLNLACYAAVQGGVMQADCSKDVGALSATPSHPC